MKCIVIETSPERTNAHTITNEDGTPHIYATMAEARAELRANGYSYNRENQRYYIKSTEYRAYIIREDSDDYAATIEQAEQNAAPEYIEPAEAQWSARHAAAAVVDAYAAAKSISPADVTPEQNKAAYAIASVEIIPEAERPAGYTTATEEQRATVAAMVEAIAAKATEDADTLKTYPTEGAAFVAGARELVPIITHEDAADAYAAAEEAAQAIPAAHNRKRHDARTAAVDAIVRSRARYANKEDAAAHIAGQPVDYLHRHTVNLGTGRYPDYRPAYEQRRADRLYLSATASKTGKSLDRVSISFVVLVLD